MKITELFPCVYNSFYLSPVVSKPIREQLNVTVGFDTSVFLLVYTQNIHSMQITSNTFNL